MNRFLIAALAAAVPLVATSPALAQDGAVVPFEGPRVEGLLGYETQQSPFPGEAGDSNGLLYGVAGGYDVRRGNLVFGGEAELTGATTDTRGDGIVAAGDRIVIDSGRDLYVGGRVGLVVTPRAMVYGKLGYTNARVNETYSGSATVAAYDRGRNNDGLRIGGGAEVATGGNTYAKAEYRYSTYAGDAIDHRHQFMIGGGFRF